MQGNNSGVAIKRLPTEDGTQELYEVDSSSGLKIILSNYGATLLSCKFKSRDSNELEEITLNRANFDKLKDPALNACYGATCGRTAGRIANARFELNGKTYELETNNGPNFLHGGSEGYHRRFWSSEELQNVEVAGKFFSGVAYTLVSLHLDQGLPAELRVKSEYLVSSDNQLFMRWSAENTDQNGLATPLNLCNHAYFNLSGNFRENTIGKHILQLNSEQVLEMGDFQIPTGTLVDVKGTPFDFTSGSPIEANNRLTGAIDGGGKPGIDHAFAVKGAGKGELVDVATLKHEASGRVMNIVSTHPSILVYTSNWIPEAGVDEEIEHQTHGAVALETCQYPDAINKLHEGMPSYVNNLDASEVILAAGETKTFTTIHTFKIE